MTLYQSQADIRNIITFRSIFSHYIVVAIFVANQKSNTNDK